MTVGTPDLSVNLDSFRANWRKHWNTCVDRNQPQLYPDSFSAWKMNLSLIKCGPNQGELMHIIDSLFEMGAGRWLLLYRLVYQKRGMEKYAADSAIDGGRRVLNP